MVQYGAHEYLNVLLLSTCFRRCFRGSTLTHSFGRAAIGKQTPRRCTLGAGKLCIWTWEFDPKNQEIDMSVSWSIMYSRQGKLGKTHPNWRIVSVWDVDALFTLWEHTFFFVSLDQFLLNGFQHGLCSAIAIRINSSTKWCWLWRCMALHSLYGKKGCSSRQENARDGSSDPHDPSPADGFSAGREHEKRSHMEDIAQKTSWKFKALATLFTFLQVFMT